MEKSKGKNRVVRVVVPWVTGLHHLPEPGGLLDQPYRLMMFFEQFMRADRNTADNRINSKT
jgi:hypothetical protein